jgi:acyl carrier protein
MTGPIRNRWALPVAMALLLLAGCGVYRDDTTGETRHVIARQLGQEYNAVTPYRTLGDLGCDDLDVVEIIMALEEEFGITIPDEGLEALAGQDGWSDITVLELANLARSQRASQ